MSSLPNHTFGYQHDGSTVIWDVVDIWKVAERLPTIRIPLDYFTGAISDVQEEYDNEDWDRVDSADISYPILVGRLTESDGYLVIDGFHRLAKYQQRKLKTVSAKVINRMPTPCYVKGKPFKIDGLNFDWKAKAISNESIINPNLRSLPKWLTW